MALTFVQGYTNARGEYDGRWNDIHDTGYNRRTGCDSCAQNEEAVWGSYPMCVRVRSVPPRCLCACPVAFTFCGCPNTLSLTLAC